MKKFALLIVYVYAFCCPVEFVLNVWFGSSVKLIAGAAVVVTAFYFLVEQKHTFKFTAFQACLLGWAGLEMASVLWTTVTKSTYSLLTSYLMMTAFVVLLSLFPFSKKEADLLIKFYSLGTVILAISVLVMGKVDGSAHLGRMTISILGRNQDPNGLAAIILSGAFYSLHKGLKNKKFIIPYIAAFLVQAAAIFYTGSRGGLVAFVLALVVFIAINIPRKRRGLAILIAMALIVAGYFALQAFLPERLFDRLFDLSGYLEVSGIGRVKIWTTALKEFVNSPVFGFGTTGHFYFFSQTFGAEIAMHNTFLCVAFETGLVGLVMFCVPFMIAFSKALKNKNALIVAILIANVVAAFFLDALHVRFLWNALIFGIIYKNSMESEENITKEKKV